MSDMPDKSNFFATIKTNLPKENIAKLYRGWEQSHDKEASEVSNDWAELTIEVSKSGLVLLHGCVANVEQNIKYVVAPLREARLSFSAETYGKNDELLVTIKE